MAELRSELVARVSAVASRMVDPIADLAGSIAAIPAPTNDEADRARFIAETFERLGYVDVTVDQLSDVVGRLPGSNGERALLLAAHIDTVFPRDTPIDIARRGDVLAGPGIGDNSVSVAAVALLAEALKQLDTSLPVDVFVTGNVGEEGLGDLRGMRAVVDGLPQLAAAIAVEGHSLGRITNQAVGSRRLKVTVTGPGGHSWGDAGRPSAIHAVGRLIACLDGLELPSDPKTTLNVGLIHGGISVNTIAPTASVVIDLRSISMEALTSLVSRVEREIAAIGTEDLSVITDVVGDRPAGEMPTDRGLVPIGVSVLRSLGIEASCDASSTDANIPISRGIPSMCIGLTSGGHVHRVDEFIRLRPLATGFAQLILNTILASEAIASDALG